MNIGIDIDDTISETFATLLPFAQKYSIEDLKTNGKLNYKKECNNHFYIETMEGWDEEQSANFWEKYYGEILKNIKTKIFASETIKKLKQDGHKIYLITARWPMENCDTRQITINWLEDNDVEYDELIMNAEDKLKIAVEKNIDVFIDDSFKNCKNIADNSNIKVYMMNSNANGAFEDENVERIFSWPEVEYIIKNIAKE